MKAIGGIGTICMAWGLIWSMFFPSIIWLAIGGLGLMSIAFPFLKK